MQYIDINNKFSRKNGKETPVDKGDKAVGNAIKNIIGTPVGTMPGHPEFGCNMGKFLFEQLDPFTVEMIKEEIIYSLARWEQRIDNTVIEVFEDFDYSRVVITIRYKIKNDIESSTHEYIYTQQLV